MAEHNKDGLDSRALAERKSKRLEEALSAFSAEQTKETVSKLLEEYVDDSGKNYFGAGTRDTTLYFADEEYIREIAKEKEKSTKPKAKAEKTSVVDKIQKLTSIIPKHEKSEDKEKNNIETQDTSLDLNETTPTEEAVISTSNEETTPEISTPAKNTPPEVKTNTNKSKKKTKVNTINKEDAIPQAEVKNDNSLEISSSAESISKEVSAETPNKTDNFTPEPEPTIVITPVKTQQTKDQMPVVGEPTIAITPVKAEDTEKETPTEEDTKEMRREFFDNEIEVDEVPRRRRKASDLDKASEETSTVTKDEDLDEDFDDDYEDDDLKEDETEKKNKFGGFFKHKKKDDIFDDDDFDDDDFDDDDYDDDDYDDYDSPVKKVINVIVIIVLVCSTAFFAASNYTNSKKLESANAQINELNNGGSSDEQVVELQSELESLRAENAQLKGGSTATTPANNSTEPTTSTSSSTIISGTDSDSTTSASGSTYTIKAGDTGSKICNAVYGQYTEELWQGILSANGMTTSSVYHPGDVLQIP